MYLCRLKCPKEHHKVMKKEKRDNYTFLTHAPVHHVIFTMAIPTIISMLSTSMYNLADTYFVGSINTQSVAAVGVSFAAMAVIQAIGFFFGHGAGNYVSRQLGAKHTEEAQKMATTGFVLSFLTGLLIAILGHVFLTPLCLLMGSTPTILPYTERYLGIILLGAPFMTTSLTLNNLMRFQGNTMYAMKGIMSGVLLNLIIGDQFLSIIMNASIYKEEYANRGYQPELLSRSTEDSATVTSVLVPWTACGMTQSTVLEIGRASCRERV